MRIVKHDIDWLVKKVPDIAAWGGWKISYQKIAPDVYSVKLGEKFQNEE